MYTTADCGHDAYIADARLLAACRARGETILCNRCYAAQERTPTERSASARKGVVTRRFKAARAEWNETAAAADFKAAREVYRTVRRARMKEAGEGVDVPTPQELMADMVLPRAEHFGAPTREQFELPAQTANR